ncbi:MAG: SufE family protein [Ignavibacteriae bacterium]|nr:SufE family protein [Ignavibacteriota bacterium]MCB9244507.1 SufE family protein [Ignavibacteriales bacterium]
MESITSIEDQIVEEFSVFDDWMDKYDYIIDIGKNLPPLEDAYKTDENKVTGCQSQVWLTAEMKDGDLYYKADSDAIITKGLIALLIRVLSGHKPEEILDTKLDFLDKIGMKEHLSPTRSNGLVSMIAHMKKYAEKAKLNEPLSLN